MTGKRTRYSAEFKARVALEALRGELTTAQVAALVASAALCRPHPTFCESQPQPSNHKKFNRFKMFVN